MNACAALCLIVALALAGTALAQSSGGPYALKAHAIAGGGRATSGPFDLRGSIAQHDAGTRQSGGAFDLTGGFHRRATGVPDNEIFDDGFE